jgi:pimeloyl-ACP methyl ester carboxylesterase
VAAGAGDRRRPADPPAWSEELAAGIPGARLVVVAGAAHLSRLDQPERVTEALVAWASGEE